MCGIPLNALAQATELRILGMSRTLFFKWIPELLFVHIAEKENRQLPETTRTFDCGMQIRVDNLEFMSLTDKCYLVDDQPLSKYSSSSLQKEALIADISGPIGDR